MSYGGLKKRMKRGTAVFMAAILTVSAWLPAGGDAELAFAAAPEESGLAGAGEFSLNEVKLTNPYFTNAFAKENEYLLSFDTDKILAGFRETAGLDMKGATRYGGWENSLIGGHSVGHYLTACAQAYASLDDGAPEKAQYEKILKTIIDGLKECQDKVGTGFIFGSTLVNKSNIEQQFDNVEKNLTNITTQAWVPWYTMHKILAGLVDVYQCTGYAPAKEVASRLGDWIYNRVSKWSASTQTTVLNIEYGGMNDCLYDLYSITGKDTHAVAAHMFDETKLFERVKNDEANVLNNRHANTTIPKFVGALNRYVQLNGKTVDGEKIDASDYLAYAEAFWTMVTEKHTYITGGNSEWEHFGADNILDAERTNCNCETCNTYNMLKLTRTLFEITGDKKYSDYYENTYLNAILSSQNPETGMTTYFQPMATGYFKVFSTQYDKFWCCTGSGMENFTKLQDSLYFKKDNSLIVNQYISSAVTWTDKKVTVEQTTEIPNTDTAAFVVKTQGGDADINIYFRLPDWLAGDASITVNGTASPVTAAGGYALVKGPFANNTKIEITLPMQVTAYNLPDNENTYAFKYGPVVLSALLGSGNMNQTTTGVNVTIPATKVIDAQYVSSGTDTIRIVNGNSVAEFMEHINEHLVKEEGKLAFTLKDTDANLTFVTHYSQYQERYGIYWNYVSDDSAVNVGLLMSNKENARLQENLLDTVQPGYGQYENDDLHQMQEAGNKSVGVTSDGTYRYANADGSFSYRMIVDENEATSLYGFFRKADNGKTMKISVGDTVIYEEKLNYSGADSEYSVLIPVPAEAISKAKETVSTDGGEKTVVTFTFTGAAGEESAKLCTFLYTIHSFGTNTDLQLASDDGEISSNNGEFRLMLKEDQAEAHVTFTIGDQNGYLMINGSIVDDTQVQKLPLNGKYTDFAIVVYAEDHTTSKEYKLTVEAPGEGIRANVDPKVAYFVDCGDHGPATVSDGDLFGTHNSVTEQLLGKDPVTGYTWGLVDDATDQYNGSGISDGLYTANTWCYEQNDCTDGLGKTETNRYTKNQFENNIDRHLDYEFELEDGAYTLEIGLADPWNVSNAPTIYADKDTDHETVIAKEVAVATTPVVEGSVNVTGGKLTLNFRSNSAAINVSYIKISYVNVPEPPTEASAPDAEPGDDNSSLPVIIIVIAIVVITAAAIAAVVISKKKKGKKPEAETEQEKETEES